MSATATSLEAIATWLEDAPARLAIAHARLDAGLDLR